MDINILNMRLPPDLFYELVAYLDPSDMANASLTCRALNPIFTHHCYRNISLDRFDSQESPRIICRRILLLLRTLLRNSSHRNLVRNLCITFSPGDEDAPVPESLWDPETECPLEQSDLDQLKAHVLTQQFPQTQEWIEHLQNGSVGVIVALLLSFMPNLLSISLDLELRMRHRFLALLTCHAISCLHSPSWFHRIPFEQLIHVDYTTISNVSVMTGPTDAPGFDLDQVPLLFYLPSIESIAGLMPFRPEFTWSDLPLPPSLGPPNPTSLTSLRLENSLVDSDSLDILLSATPNLKKLEYVLNIPWASSVTAIASTPGSTDFYKLDLLPLALAFLKARSIRDLHISINASWLSDPRLQYLTEFPSLAPLENLRKLDIPLELLLGSRPLAVPSCVDSLPWGLESLTVLNSGQELHQTWTFRDTMEKMEYFVRSRGNGNSVLEKVCFELNWADTPTPGYRNGWSKENFEEWKEIGKKNGVDCKGVEGGIGFWEFT